MQRKCNNVPPLPPHVRFCSARRTSLSTEPTKFPQISLAPALPADLGRCTSFRFRLTDSAVVSVSDNIEGLIREDFFLFSSFVKSHGCLCLAVAFSRRVIALRRKETGEERCFMETIRKQASKLREQVAKQQQVVFRQLSAHFGSSSAISNEADIHCHEQLKKLYSSTTTAKHYQKDLVRGIEGLIYTGSKQMHIVGKLADDCSQYGDENQSDGKSLSRISVHFGASHKLIGEERQNLHRVLACQVSEPLREMISGAPLEDARHLTHRYQRTRQEVEVQAAEVVKQQMKARDSGGSAENSVKLQVAESKLSDLRFALSALGVEAIAAMKSVDTQQQCVTFQKVLVMVNAERSYCRNVVNILDNLHAEMVWQEKLSHFPESTACSTAEQNAPDCTDTDSNKSNDLHAPFLAKILHSFESQAESELSLSAGAYVVVRQVAPNGWSEGECNGKAGWFPSAYIERSENISATMCTDTRL